MNTRLAFVLLASSVAAGLVPAACADVFRPAYLDLRESSPERYDVTWRVPAQSEETRLALHVNFPEHTLVAGPVRTDYTGDSIIERWSITRPGGLDGSTLRIEGRAAGVTDVIVRMARLDGSTQVERLAPGASAFEIEQGKGRVELGWSYLVLGVEHILGGIDHLLFVLALLLVVRGVPRLVATVTAFTVAHTITLVGSSLGWINVPGPPVEAIIALSIVFVAAEAVHALRGKSCLTARAPWVVAFSFGLLHGLGFAGALAEIGLPQNAIPLALFMFNVGVELGQLAFVALALAAWVLWRRLRLPVTGRTRLAVPYAIGSIATFWLFQRVVAFA